MDSKSQSRKLFHRFITYSLICVIECVSVIIVLLRIPADPKNAWLFGISKSRWLMLMGGIFLAILFVVSLLSLIINWRKEKFEKLAIKFRSFHHNSAILLGIFFLFLVILVSLFTFHQLVNTQVSSITTRVVPLLVLSELLALQTIILLIFSHSLLTDQPISKGFVDIFFFPANAFKTFFQFIENQINALANKFNRRVLIVLILLSPLLMTTALVWLSFNTTLASYIPTGSDEMVYWREILTFKTIGFEGGQYSTDELTAEVKLSRFDAHGPAFPVFYGIFGKIFGWQLLTGVILNHIFLTLALFGFIYLSRPDKQQLLLLWLLLITFWPIWFYLPSTRVEGLFYAIAIAMAGLFSRLIDLTKNRVWPSILLVLMIFFASSMRLSWSFVFISLIGVLIGNYSWKNLLKIVLLAIIPIGIVLLFFRLFVSPYPLFSYDTIHSIGSGELNQIVPIIENTIENTIYFFSTRDNPLFVLLRYQLLWVLIVSVVDLYRGIKPNHRSDSPKSNPISFLNSSNLGLVIIFNLAIHTVHAGREYRLWSPHLLLSLLILLFSSRQRLVLGVIISNMLFSVAFGNTFYAVRYQNYRRDNADIVEIQNAISEYIVYQPTENHWCNTIDVSRYSRETTWGPWMLFLPDEFGVTSILSWDDFYHTKLKARFVLLDPEYIQEHYPRVFKNVNLEPLTETPIGTLYYNKDSGCPPIE